MKYIALLLCALLAASCSSGRKASSSSAFDPYRTIAVKLSGGWDKMTNRKVAVLPFSYTDSHESADGVVIAERLLTRVMQEGKLELVERGLLAKVLAELKLQHSGAVDDSSIRRLGKILGVEAVVTGTLTRQNDGQVEINARLIKTETAAILAAAVETVPVDWSSRPASRAALPRQPAGRPAAVTPASPPLAPAWSGSAADLPKDGLVGYWKFDEGAGLVAADLSGKGNHARLHGPAWVNNGGAGYSLVFDGRDDYFLIDDSASLRMSSAVTVAAWINYRSINFSQSGAGLFCKGINYCFLLGGPENWNSNLAVFMEGVTSAWQRGETRLPPDEWHHVVFAYDGSGIAFYTDGKLDKAVPASGAMRPSSELVSTGWGGWHPRAAAGYWAPLDGYVDELAVYNRALSAAEIAAVYGAYFQKAAPQ